jgi:thiol-disulfide isomerase/thioredoxin
MTGLWVALGVLIGATVFGLWYRRANGRIVDHAKEAFVPGLEIASPDEPPVDIERDPGEASPAELLAALDGRLGEHATVVQFSTVFCQPCRATRRILEEVSVMVPGVSHVEIDAEDNLDLVRRLHIRRTPTVLFLDARGRLRKHASGQPRKADVIAALGEIVPGGPQDFTI